MANDIEFTLNLNPERESSLGFNEIFDHLDKKYKSFILSRETGSHGGKEHFHMYIKDDQLPKNFKKSFCNKFNLMDATKLEAKVGKVKWVENWVGYITKDSDYKSKGFDKHWIEKCSESYKERMDKKAFKTSSRQMFLYHISKNYDLLEKTQFSPDKKKFLAVRNTLMIDKILPPGLKLDQYVKITLNWKTPDTLHPYVATIIARLLGQKCIDPEKEEFDNDWIHDNDCSDFRKIFNYCKS